MRDVEAFFLSFFLGARYCIFAIMDSLTTYVNYFENIARALNSISHTDDDPHFESIHSAALFNGVQSKIDDRVFWLEDYTASFKQSGGQVSKMTTGAFSILKKIDGSGDYAKATAAKAWAEAECQKVLSKVLQDKKNSVPAVRGFDFNEVVLMAMDNQPSGWWGMRVEFGLMDNTGFCYHSEDWTGTVPPEVVCKPLSEYTAAELLADMSETQLNGILEELNVLLLEDGEMIEIE